MHSSLPRIELIVYFVVIVSTMYYLLLHVYEAGNMFLSENYENLKPGWSILGRRKDITDYEWASWKHYMSYSLPWIVLHLLLSQFFQYFNKEFLPLIYFVFTCMFITLFSSITSLLPFLLTAIAFYAASLLKSALSIWFVAVFILTYNTTDSIFEDNRLDVLTTFSLDIAYPWFILKCIAFFVSEIKYSDNFEKLSHFITYSFYFPTFFFGPFIPFNEFFSRLQSPWKSNSFNFFLFNVLRFSFWFLIYELATHFLYCDFLCLHLTSTVFYSKLTLNGIGFCLSQYFYLKYLVLYGLSGAISTFDGFNAPPPPKCVNRIHLYSNMWRYFDRGYYLFTVDCIFKPLCNTFSDLKGKKILASIFSFIFVYIWHGATISVFYWTIFNFVGISLEACGRYFSTFSIFTKLKQLLSPQNYRRFYCLLISPVWILAIISNSFFFAQHVYGFKMIDQFRIDSILFTLFVILISYCLSQLSVEAFNWELKLKSEK